MSRRHQETCARRKTYGALAALAGIVSANAPATAFADIIDDLYELRMACETGDGDACLDLGRAYETRKDIWGREMKGEGVKRDDRRAAYYFRQSCALKVAEACNDLGRLYETGKGVEENPKEALRHYRAACSLRGGGSCSEDRNRAK